MREENGVLRDQNESNIPCLLRTLYIINRGNKMGSTPQRLGLSKSPLKRKMEERESTFVTVGSSKKFKKH